MKRPINEMLWSLARKTVYSLDYGKSRYLFLNADIYTVSANDLRNFPLQ